MHNNCTTVSLLARRALAEKATPGPWVRKGGYLVYGPWGDRPVSDKEGILNPADAAHIAANDPPTVIADIDEILRLRAQVERLEKEADWLAERAGAKDCLMADTVENCTKKGFPCIACFRTAARKAVEEIK